MWSREQLKSNAKIFLKKYLKEAIIVCLVFMLFNILFSTEDSRNFFEIKFKNYLGLSNTSNNVSVSFSPFSDNLYENFSFSNGIFNSIKNIFTFYVTTVAFIIIVVIRTILKIFIFNPTKIGMKKFFLNGYAGNISTSDIFSSFTEGTWINIGVKIFIKDIYLYLWTLLFIIPGIYKFYQYYYVDYILAENPNMSINDAIDLSKKMTDGEKFEIFALNISFIGWDILNSLILNIGSIILTPYKEATFANLYIFKTINRENEEYVF